MPRRKWKRFPRLNNSARYIILSKILIKAYNTLAIRRVEEKKKYRLKYDIVEKEKMKGRNDIENRFLMMSVLLDEERIDPLLYLQTMSCYGRFRHTSYLPRPNQLASPKSIKTFKWLVRKEREKYFLDSDWKGHLEGMLSSALDKERIIFEIKESWEFLKAPLELDWCKDLMDVGLASVIHSDHLSPWFLAVCKPFLKLEGLVLLQNYKRREVKNCMNALMRDRSLLKTVVKAYKRHLPV